jgi:hypothetical protein
VGGEGDESLSLQVDAVDESLGARNGEDELEDVEAFVGDELLLLLLVSP